ncbi:MAG: transposase [Candidatus Odinarchaeota archaeon]|nr:transposase [Candidatus Odinarchaeota archaeon]
MKEEGVKAYKIPIEAPRDLIEAYFKVKRKALREMLNHVTYSQTKKAHLNFKAEDRRKLRNNLLKDWRYSKHYIDSAINSVIGLVKGWIKLHNRGKAKSKPKITKKTVYIKTTLFSYGNGILKISIEPNKRYLEVDLRDYDWIPKDFDKIGGLILTEGELIITVKREVRFEEPKCWTSFDINLTNITALINGNIVRYDLKKLYHFHRIYEIKRKKIQKLSKHKPKTANRLMKKYSKREKNRVKDLMHKLTTKITRELADLKSGAILENLKNIKSRILNKSRNLNRKLSKWNARRFQFMLEYKLKWLGLPVKYVNPKNSSKTCPLCSGRMATYEGRLMKCEKCGFNADRDVIAVLNLQMWGSGVTPKAPLELSSSMMEKLLVDQNLPISMKVHQR